MTIAPFNSDKELIAFARRFFANRVETFRKDIAVCLTANKHGEHAYFPALITCIAFADLLSGLYAGKLEGHGPRELTAYAAKFMNSAHYGSLQLEVLREAFRHKLAHLAYPYVVFDTATKPRSFIGQPARRITWTVYAAKRSLPIEVLDLPTRQFLSQTTRPWPVWFNCRVKISVRKLFTDIVKSIYGPSGYLRTLQVDRTAREHFARCMVLYYPP